MSEKASLVSLLSSELFTMGSGAAMGIDGEVDSPSLTLSLSLSAMKWGMIAYRNAMHDNGLVEQNVYNHTAYSNPYESGLIGALAGSGLATALTAASYSVSNFITNCF